MGIFTIIAIGAALLAGGASYVQAKKAQKKAKKLANSMAGVLLNKESNIEPIPVIYGTRRVGGTRVFLSTEGSTNEYLYMALVLCEGQVGSIAGIELDGTPITDSRFAGLTALQLNYGTEDQAASGLLQGATGWTLDHRLRGVAYIALRLKWDQDVFSGIPDVTALVTGKRVYDPRTGNTQWSDNPALCIRDYLTNTRYGKGLPDSAIDDVAFSQAANDCDAFSVTPYSGATSNIDLFQCNAVIDTGEEIFRNMEKMLLGCRGFLPYTNGKYGLYIDKSKTSTLDLGLDNIIGSISFAGEKKEDKFNRVVVKFVNPNTKWQEDAAIWPDAGSTEETTYLAEDGGVLLVDEIDMETVTNYYAARDFARIFLLRSRNGIRVSLQATSEAMNLIVGDVVRLTHPTPGFTNKPFQVEQVSLNYDGTVNLDLLEYDSTIYTYDTASEETSYPDTNLPDPFVVSPPSGLTLTDSTRTEADGTIIPAVLVQWTAPVDYFVNSYEVQYKLSTESTYKSLVTWSTEFDLTLPTSGGTYDIRVRAINTVGARSSSISDQISVSGDTTPPGVPTGLSVSADNHLIIISWTNPTDSDFLHVEIKSASQNIEGNATTIAKVDSESYADGPFSVGTTRYYWIRSVDRSGNASAWVAAGGDTTVVLETADLTSEVHNSILEQEILRVELEGETILNLETGLEVDIQNLGDVAIFVNESNTTIQGNIDLLEGNIQNLTSLIGDVTAGVGDVYLQDSEPVAGVGGVPSPIPDGSRWYDTDDNNAPYYWNGTAWVSLLDPRIGQNAAAVTALQTRMTTAEGDIDTNTADISTNASAITANSTAISTLDSTVTTQGASITAISADITDLETALFDEEGAFSTTSNAVTVLQSRVTQTETDITSNSTSITTLQSDLTAAESDITTNATAITALDTRVTSTEGSITSQAAQITNLQSDLTTAESDIVNNASAITALTTRVTTAEGTITVNSSDITSLSSDLTTAQADILTNAGAITTAQTDISANSTAITSLDTRVTTVEGQVTSEAQSTTVLTTRLDFLTRVEDEADTNPIELESTGELDLETLDDLTAGTSTAIQSLDSRTTVAEGLLTTQASAITDLESTVNDPTTGVAANASGLSSLSTRVTSAEGSITSISSDVTTLQADLTTAEGDIAGNATAISSLGTRVTAAEGAITVNASDITTLESSLTTTNSNVTANATAISGLDTRVTSAEGSITSIASDVSTLQADLTTAEGDITANGTAISSLSTRVTTAEGNITSISSDVTTLQSDLTTAEGDITSNASAISGLDTRVTSAEGTITSQATDITDLQSSLTTANSNITANATAISSLDTRVTSAEGTITSQSSDITTLQADLSTAQSDITTAQSNITANATAVSSLDTRVTSAEGSITSIASDVTSLTTTVGNNTASITTNATSIDGVEANYGVKVDINGRVTGFGLLSTTRTATPSSEFAVIADKFTVVNPASTNDAPIIPFQISGTKVQFTSNVEINGDLVTTGTINASTVSVTNLNADNISAGTLNANRIQLDGVTLTASSGNLIIATGGVGTTQVAGRAITNTARADMASNTNYSTSFISLASLTGQTYSNGDLAEISWGLRAHPEASGAPYIAIRVLVYQGTTLKTTQYFVGDSTYDTTNWAQIQQVLFSSTMQYSITADDSDWRFILQAATNTNGTFPRSFRAPGTYIQAVRLKR